jgi:uncharacterized membrane protein YoaK (UPF0700 family)
MESTPLPTGRMQAAQAQPSAPGGSGALQALRGYRPLRWMLLTLTGVTGLIDAVSYLGLGHIFTANMTGNVVLLGFALAGAGQTSIVSSLLSLTAFLLGALGGGRLARILEDSGNRWIVSALVVEVACVGAAAGTCALLGTSPDSRSGALIVILLALAMGIRNATVRRLAIPDLTTTVLTLTLTGLAADTQLSGAHRATIGWRVGAAVAMFVGAAVGAVLLRMGLTLPLVAAVGVLAAITLGYVFRTRRDTH